MPILHTQLAGQAQTPDGRTIQLPPPIALLQRGPIVQVTIGVEQNMARQLVVQGVQLPNQSQGLRSLIQARQQRVLTRGLPNN